MKVPARLDPGLAQDTPPDTIMEYFVRIYLEAVDSIVKCIHNRFEQEGYEMYAKLQQLNLNLRIFLDFSCNLSFKILF